jgi:purine-nucleoside phosphorylase
MRSATKHLIRAFDGLLPETALILGSGLGKLAKELGEAKRIPYEELQGFPHSGVSGHAGEVIAGNLDGIPVVLLSGRSHYYERGDAAAMRLPLEVLRAVGARRLILTNSAGSLREDMPPGSVMMITDHINWSGRNPLIGEHGDERFASLTNAYSGRIMAAFRCCSEGMGETLHEGIYMWFSGPSFETPAEIKAARMLGADAVGMSTVPEIILGRYLGFECAAFSVITNFGAGMSGAELSHAETKRMAPKGGALLAELIRGAMKEITQ